MKLHRFTAGTTQQAMQKVHESLGAEALIYSTRNFLGGVEVVAALPHKDEILCTKKPFKLKLETAAQPQEPGKLVEQLNHQLHMVYENVRKLSNHMNIGLEDDDEQSLKKNSVLYYLKKLGFRGNFCYQFVNDFLSSRHSFDTINEKEIETALMTYLAIDENEPIYTKNICALVGPTGIGKTTTIIKMAKRYISQFGSNSIGLITIDYKDVAAKNQLYRYSESYSVDLEFANDASELALALRSMKNKSLVLIDTYGISQKDTLRIEKLLEMLEKQEGHISSYLALPCNVQDAVLNDIAHAFYTPTLKGCILTKQDECINIAAALSTSIVHALKIMYICNGQSAHHIKKADKDTLLQFMTATEKNNKSFADKKNRVTDHFKEE